MYEHCFNRVLLRVSVANERYHFDNNYHVINFRNPMVITEIIGNQDFNTFLWNCEYKV